jgi:group I intron endonuclease
MGYIYKITNIISGMAYIGQTTQKDPNTRWRGHINAVKYGNGCPVLSHAIQKYGPESFKFEVLIICFDSDVNYYEQSYIERYKTLVPDGYNVQVGGNVGGMFKGHHHTEETKKLISEKSAIYYSNPDIRKEHGKKVSAGLKTSEKWKLAVAENRAQRKGLHIFIGSSANRTKQMSRTEEQKKKISDAVKKWYTDISNGDRYKEQSKRMMNKNGRSVKQYTVEGEFINEFDCIAEAARQTGLTRKNVQACVSGYTKTAGGFVWKGGPKKEKQEPTSQTDEGLKASS